MVNLSLHMYLNMSKEIKWGIFGRRALRGAEVKTTRYDANLKLDSIIIICFKAVHKMFINMGAGLSQRKDVRVTKQTR